MTISDLLEIMDGCEVLSPAFEGVVLVQDGKLIRDGKEISRASLVKQDYLSLFDDYFYQEFGTYNAAALL